MPKSPPFHAVLLDTVAHGALHRAVVGVPADLTEFDQPLQERVVFFEGPPGVRPDTHLEALLARAWCIDTDGWGERGAIYNIQSAAELRELSLANSAPSDLQLLEIGAGREPLETVGPARLRYARVANVDLFVTPRVARRLREALDAIELMYAAQAPITRQ